MTTTTARPIHASPSRRPARRSAPLQAPARTVHAAVALGAAGLGAWLAWHHPLAGPLSSPFASGLFLLVAAACAAWPSAWLVALPALLPWLGLYPWTGWLTVEEFDLAVLAVAAGGHARAMWAPVPRRAAPDVARSLWWWLFAAALGVSCWRGVVDAGGWQWGWWQGYREPLNGVRLAKSFVLASLLWPLWTAQLRRAPADASRLALGFTLGLAAAALAALWERLAFTDLLDFSTDYRTTGLFWEMHVGGAALDGFLAFSFPFAMHQLLRARGAWRWAAAAATVLLGGYACLTTFSRAVYLSIPLGLVVLVGLRARQCRRDGAAAHAPMALPAAAALLIGFGIAAAWMFPGSGYRGLAALLGAVALLLPLAAALRWLGPAGWVAGIVLGSVASGVAWGASVAFAKGAYLAYAVAWLVTLALLWAGARPAAGAAHGLRVAALAGFGATLGAMLLVAWHWGERGGLERALPVAAVIAAVAFGAGRRSAGRGGRRVGAPADLDGVEDGVGNNAANGVATGFVDGVREGVAGGVATGADGGRTWWPASRRWQGSLVGAMAGMGLLVAVFAGGAYMSGRFSTGGEDGRGRVQHWERGLAQLHGAADWAFGKGLGRFAATLALSGDVEDETGDYRLEATAAGPRLVLTGGRHLLGWGEMLRVSQRVEVGAAPVKLDFDARVAQPVKLHFEICQKHLLYNAGCAMQAVMLQPGGWRHESLAMEGSEVTRGHAYAPRLIAFSVGVETNGGRVELGDVRLTAADGRALLANGDFSGGLAHWFFSSDRYHLPWHIKNLEMHVLFEQGAVGLALFAALMVGALWRVSFGDARAHPLAPALAAALVGALGVGLTDSLLDMPRIAFLFYFVGMVALGLPRPARAAPVAA